MFLQETGLNVVPGGIIPVMHVSQYDVGRELKFVLYSGYDYASLESGTTVTIEGTKPDGHGFQYSGVLDQNAHTATFVTTEQMTVLAGAIECKLTLYLNAQRIGTALFILDVEKAGINDSTIISDTELPLIIAQATEQMERAEAAADAAALSETNAATSETNAAASETNAANSEIICGSFMRMAGVSAASAEQSAIISGSFMRTAGNSADDAEASATSANVNALKSEGHALGTQNGTPVSSDSPYYHNNAKYWADEARQSSAGGVAASVIATAEPTNISSHAYAIGDQFVYNGILYTATSAISVGSTIVPGTNCSISDTITEQIGNAGHTILDEDGTTYPQRSKLQFEGCEVTDDSTNDITKIKAEGGVTGVKGNAESDYRTGNVNLTPSNIGAVDIEDYEEDIGTTDISSIGSTVTGAISNLYSSNRRIRKDITSQLTNLPTAVEEQNLGKYGYTIGDYFTGASGYTYTLADMNTFKGTATPYCITGNHLGIVVATHATSKWHTGSASSVGYNGSTLHSYLKGTVLTNIKSDLTALFGDWNSHLLAHSKLLTTATAAWGWQADQYISALTCTQVDGGSQWNANRYQEGEASKSLELFRKYKWTEIFGNEYVWLRNISNYDSSAGFACRADDAGTLPGLSVVTTDNYVAGLIIFN